MINEWRMGEPGKKPVFTIIIPSWNNLAYLKLCIEGLRANSSLDHQIIVHINDGSDGTHTWVNSEETLDFTHSKENIGICYGLNGASRIANGEYIVYMNDDMYVCPGWDEALMQEIESVEHKMFFISSTMIENGSGNPCTVNAFYGSNPENFQKEKLLADYEGLKREHWTGATWPPNVVHREVWDMVGGYSTEFSPGMGSDPDFAMKLWQLGVRYYKGVGTSLVYHFGTVTTKRKKISSGRKTFLNKWGLSISTFNKRFLKRGTPWSGTLLDVKLSSLRNLLNKLKRLK